MKREVRLISAAGVGLSLVMVMMIVFAARSAEAQEAGSGQDVYLTNCSGCHQPDGLGIPGSFPPLSGNPDVQDSEYVKTVVTGGLPGLTTLPVS